MITDLKKALAMDLETLKHLDLGIISAGAYYKRLFAIWFHLFVLLLAIQSAACFFAVRINAWDYAPHTERWEKSNMERANREESTLHSPSSLYDLGEQFPDASQEELKMIQKEKERKWQEGFLKRKKERQLKYEEARLDEHALLRAKMVFGVFFSSLLISLFGLGFIKNYIIFKLQISPKLRTGAYLIQKTQWALTGFFFIFGMFAFLFIPLFEQDVVFFSSIPCLILAAIATSIVINMEASRIGVRVLSKAISNFFHKEKESV
ncbi:TPA: hypothetical protein ACPSKY_003499 [Legionella bozemanae]|nr:MULTISPECIES: hypothetical protein [Legionellaceae]KTC70052.1 hypothetical protein Lboz_2995 [Legionella bozemanae]KTC81751.1 hypothetical protein Lche_0792 [Legionella cherrii]MCW8485161.1 hypothetical protein [Fluoribacter dumoffii]STP13936.1 Uncharacterised protein [Legionella bozemanae]